MTAEKKSKCMQTSYTQQKGVPTLKQCGSLWRSKHRGLNCAAPPQQFLWYFWSEFH